LLTTLTTTLTQLITNLYVSTGLLGIALAMAIESCCIPLPSEIVMPLAGIMISQGKLLPGTNTWLSLFLVALAGAIGCLIGSIAAYAIGFKGGRPLMLKYGRYVLISQHDADKADRFFQRWGSATAFFSRLLPVVRTYISLPAGISKMPFVRFCIYSFLGSLPWCFLLAYLGTVLGAHLDTLSPIFHAFDVVILVVLVILVALYVWRHIRNDHKARAEHANTEAKAAAMSAQPQWGQPSQPQWNQPAPSQSQQWGQMPPQQQSWGQPGQPSQQQQWNQPPTPAQPSQPSWGQSPMSAQPSQQPPWSQPPVSQQSWGQPPVPQQPSQQWGQPPVSSSQPQSGQPPMSSLRQWKQPPPSSQSDDDRSVRR